MLFFFAYFPQKILVGFDILYKQSFKGDNLYEILKPIFWGKKKRKKNDSKYPLLKFLSIMLEVCFYQVEWHAI